jgi:hypothetical protein
MTRDIVSIRDANASVKHRMASPLTFLMPATLLS